MAKRDEIEQQIAALQAELEADGADDYEIEIRDGDSAARLPYGKGLPWLKKKFPDLFEELLGDAKTDAEGSDPAAKGGKAGTGTDGKVTAFQRRVR